MLLEIVDVLIFRQFLVDTFQTSGNLKKFESDKMEDGLTRRCMEHSIHHLLECNL